MKYLKTETFLGEAESAEDAVTSSQLLEQRLETLQAELSGMSKDSDPRVRAKNLLDSGYVLLDLERRDEAWLVGREAFDLTASVEDWEQAVQACDIMHQSEQAESIKALAHGVWLGVTYPIDPELSVAMLNHLVEEIPAGADGAAVAATMARFVADVRAEGKQHEDLMFFTGQLLGEVANQHRGVKDQETFDVWFKHFELDDPDVFIPRLGQIVDALVTDGWWIDRDALRAKLSD